MKAQVTRDHGSGVAMATLTPSTIGEGMGQPGGRSKRLEDIRRGTKGFCHLEQIAKVHWRARPREERNSIALNKGPDGPSLGTPRDQNLLGTPRDQNLLPLSSLMPDSQGYKNLHREFNKYNPIVESQKGDISSGINQQDYFPSVQRMLQSPRPWGESARGAKQWGSTSDIVGKLKVSSSSKGIDLRRVSHSNLSKHKSSELVLATGGNCKVRRARYCLLPPSLDTSSPCSASSFGSHQGHYVHRATLVVPSMVKKACFTMTHLSSDNGLLHVIKPPPGTPLSRNTPIITPSGTPTPGASSSHRETLHTPVVLSRLDRILQGPEEHLSSLHRSTTFRTSLSEAPTLGSAGKPDLDSLRQDLGDEGILAGTEDLEEIPHLALSRGSFPRLDKGNQRGFSTKELINMFPSVVRLGVIPLPRSYDLSDPTEVATFLEHLPPAFTDIVAKCELWFQASSDNCFSMVL